MLLRRIIRGMKMRVFKVVLGVLLTAGAVARSTAPAHAALSAACQAVNSGAMNGTATDSSFFFPVSGYTGFAAGEILTFSVSGTADAFAGAVLEIRQGNRFGPVRLNLVDGSTGSSPLRTNVAGPVTLGPYTLMTSPTDDLYIALGSLAVSASFSLSLAVTCSIPGATPSTDGSARLRALQKSATRTGSRLAGSAYAAMIGDAISSGMAGANGGPGQPPSTGGLPPGASGLGMGEGHSADALRSPLMPWVNGRFSESGDDGNIDWQHTVVAAGASYALAPGLIVGAFGGYERLDFDQKDISGALDGNGGTFGTYLAWRLAPNIRLDGGIARTWLDYETTAGMASGDFDGRRWLFLTRLSGDHVAERWTLTPSAEVFWLSERQDAYTDSLGTVQGKNSFTNGRANAGLQTAYAIPLSQATTLSPYTGIFADYYFGQDDDGAGLSAIGIGDGWAARATGGLTLSGVEGWSLTLGAEAGNLGGEGPEFWTGRLSGSVQF